MFLDLFLYYLFCFLFWEKYFQRDYPAIYKEMHVLMLHLMQRKVEENVWCFAYKKYYVQFDNENKRKYYNSVK